jgi:protein involved in ribonucleotide reduction
MGIKAPVVASQSSRFPMLRAFELFGKKKEKQNSRDNKIVDLMGF